MQCCARTKCLSWMWLSHLPAPLLGSLELSRTDVLNPWFSLELFFSQFVYVPSGTVLNAKHIGPDLNGWVPALEDCQGTSESLCTTNSTIASFKCFQDRVTKYSPGPCLQLCVLRQMNPLQALGHSLLDSLCSGRDKYHVALIDGQHQSHVHPSQGQWFSLESPARSEVQF